MSHAVHVLTGGFGNQAVTKPAHPESERHVQFAPRASTNPPEGIVDVGSAVFQAQAMVPPSSVSVSGASAGNGAGKGRSASIIPGSAAAAVRSAARAAARAAQLVRHWTEESITQRMGEEALQEYLGGLVSMAESQPPRSKSRRRGLRAPTSVTVKSVDAFPSGSATPHAPRSTPNATDTTTGVGFPTTPAAAAAASTSVDAGRGTEPVSSPSPPGEAGDTQTLRVPQRPPGMASPRMQARRAVHDRPTTRSGGGRASVLPSGDWWRTEQRATLGIAEGKRSSSQNGTTASRMAYMQRVRKVILKNHWAGCHAILKVEAGAAVLKVIKARAIVLHTGSPAHSTSDPRAPLMSPINTRSADPQPVEGGAVAADVDSTPAADGAGVGATVNKGGRTRVSAAPTRGFVGDGNPRFVWRDKAGMPRRRAAGARDSESGLPVALSRRRAQRKTVRACRQIIRNAKYRHVSFAARKQAEAAAALRDRQNKQAKCVAWSSHRLWVWVCM